MLHKTVSAITVLVICLFAVRSNAATATTVVDSAALNYIYQPGYFGYNCFRIPAIINTMKGKLLAFAEARKNGCGDSGDIDLVLRRSSDGGKTWSDLQIVWNDSTNTCGNPVPVQDVSTGKIWLICSWNGGTTHEKEIRDRSSQYGRRVFVLSSSDEGKTWSKPTEITSSVKSNEWTWYATGPCHGVQISTGKYKGRLAVPVNHVEYTTGKNYAHIIYSDDHGATWRLGENTPLDNANETTIAEINDGQLMLNARNSNRKVKYRQSAVSDNGGQTWHDMHLDSTLTEPICQGSLLSYKWDKKMVLLFSNPSSQTARANLTLRASMDNGKTWSRSLVIYPGPAAYSDIAVTKHKQVACLYEAGINKPYEGIAFKTIALNQLIKL